MPLRPGWLQGRKSDIERCDYYVDRQDVRKAELSLNDCVQPYLARKFKNLFNAHLPLDWLHRIYNIVPSPPGTNQQLKRRLHIGIRIKDEFGRRRPMLPKKGTLGSSPTYDKRMKTSLPFEAIDEICYRLQKLYGSHPRRRLQFYLFMEGYDDRVRAMMPRLTNYTVVDIIDDQLASLYLLSAMDVFVLGKSSFGALATLLHSGQTTSTIITDNILYAKFRYTFKVINEIYHYTDRNYGLDLLED